MSKPKIQKPVAFRSLRVNLTITFLVLSAVVLLITGGFGLYFSFQNQQRFISAQQQFIAQDAANTVKSFTQDKFNLLASAGNIGELSGVGDEKGKLVLEKLLGIEPAFRQLVLLNTQRKEISAASRLSNLVSSRFAGQMEDSLFLKMGQEERYVSPIYIDGITSEPLMMAAVKIRDVFGDFKGILLAEVNLKFIWDLVGKIKVGNNGLVYVVDREGSLIAFADVSRVLKGENLAGLQEVSGFVNRKELPGKSEVGISKGIRGTYVVSNYVPLGIPDWAVVVESPVLEAYESVIMLFGASVLIMFLSFLLVIIASSYLSRKISRPIIKLRDATRKISKGEWDIKIELESKDEVGDLAESFNQMAENLRKSTVSIAALEKEEKRFQDVVISTGDWIWEIDAQGRYTYSNIMVGKILGYKPEEVIGKYFYDFFHPDDREELKKVALEAFARKEVIKGFPNRNIRKDGLVVTLETSGVPLIDADGKLIGYRGADRDLTERIKREEEIKTERDKAQTYLNIAAVMILAIGLDEKVLLINRKGCEILGLEEKEIIGRNWFDSFIPERMRDKVRRVFAELAKGDIQVVEYFENFILNNEGSERLIAWHNVTLRDQNNKIVGTLSSGEDITERKKAGEELSYAYEQLKTTQAQLVQSAKMASIGLLAGGVAHEINNPLTGVLNNTQLIRMMAEQKKDFNINEFRELLGIIEDSAVRCKKITQALLDFSHTSKGATQPVSLNKIIEDVTTLILHELRLQNITIERDLQPDLPQILGDPQLLQQVVFDIISNAKWAIQNKQGEKDGRICLKTRYKPQDSMVSLYIFDSGIGIPKENLDKIFEPFFTTKAVGEGTGLGLSIVYNIIKAHKGSIGLESEFGKGTTFKIQLPVA